MKKNKTINQAQIEEIKNEAIVNFKDLLTFFKTSRKWLVLICAFTLLIYANIITGDFVNLDDYSVILSDPQYKDIPGSLKTLDAYTIFMTIIVSKFGIHSSLFHIISILQHMLNGVLVFTLLSILFNKRVSLFSTFLFLAHPANTEAISWHAGYPYALRATMILITLILFALFKKSKKKVWLFSSSAVFVFTLIFYRGGGWVLIAPFLMVIMDQFIIEDKIRFRNIKDYLIFLIPSLIFVATLIPSFFKGRIESLETLYYVDTESATPLVNRIPYTIFMEYKTLFYPMTLSIYHEGKFIKPIEYAFMVIVTLAVIYGIGYFWKYNRKIAGLMLMTLFAILPSFSPVIVAWIAAERYLYIPSMFSAVIMVTGVLWLSKKLSNDNRKTSSGNWSNFTIYTLVAIILLYSVRTVFRNNDLRNSKNLWTASKVTAPYSYRVYNNMGDVLANEGDLEGAMENFKRSVALKPDYADAVHNIGHIYMVQKDYDRAIKYLQKSLDMNPRLTASSFKLALIYYEMGDPTKAKEYLEKCLAVNPTSPDCLSGMQQVTQVVPGN